MGHFNSTIKLVQMLQSAGHKIVYLDQGLKVELAKFGFQEYSTGFEIPPLFLKKEKFKFRKFLQVLSLKRDEGYIVSFEKKFQHFKKCMEELSPDIVLLDEQIMLKAIFYEICHIPVICIESKPEPCRKTNCPPFTSSYVPSSTLISKLICGGLWLLKVNGNKLKLKMIRINSGGADIYSTTSRIAASYGIDLKKRIRLDRAYGVGVKGIIRLNISPAALDFSQKLIEGTHNIGPLVNINREGEINLPRYMILCENLKRFKTNDTGHVIYCSLGSLNNLFPKQSKCFFMKLRKIACVNPEDMFVVSTGLDFDVGVFYPVPDNMYVFDYLPQADLLGYCDIMITHGGINSITECVFHKVPTLNYPPLYLGDLPGCAARTVYHKIGLMGSISKDSVKVIRRKLNYIKSNIDFYKANIHKLKKKFETKNNSLEAIEIIEGLINQTKTRNGF